MRVEQLSHYFLIFLFYFIFFFIVENPEKYRLADQVYHIFSRIAPESKENSNVSSSRFVLPNSILVPHILDSLHRINKVKRASKINSHSKLLFFFQFQLSVQKVQVLVGEFSEIIIYTLFEEERTIHQAFNLINDNLFSAAEASFDTDFTYLCVAMYYVCVRIHNNSIIA